MKHQLSIIIPILNEAETISYLLEYLLKNDSKKNIADIIVVDGGSSDGSQELVTTFISSNALVHRKQCERGVENPQKGFDCAQPDIQLINSKKGRAKQMNKGSEVSTGNILYFLHADSFPPKNFDQYIINEVEKGNEAGCFRLQFDHKHWWLRLASWLTQFHWRACRGGDQSQFITKTLFENIGGFNENYIIYEDNMLINELYKRKQFTVINKKLTSSARRYEKHGIWKLQYHFWTIYVKKWLGASADELHAYYKKHIG